MKINSLSMRGLRLINVSSNSEKEEACYLSPIFLIMTEEFLHDMMLSMKEK